MSTNGRAFYGEPAPPGADVVLRRAAAKIPAAFVHPAHAHKSDADASKLQVVPFWAGRTLAWELV